MGTAMSDCPFPSPTLGVSRLSWFSRIRHEENTPGASGQFCPSSTNSCHFKRREALDFWKLSLGMGPHQAIQLWLLEVYCQSLPG